MKTAKDMKGLSALPVVFASISIYRGAEYYYNGVIDPLYPLIFLLLTAASFFVYWQMLRMLDSVTKSARLEIETQRLTMKTDFYHKMAHDLLTPLTIVSTSIQVAKVEPEDKELMNKSQAEIMKMAGMINDALRGGDDK